MNKTGLILLLSAAVTVCLALGNEGTCKTREMQRQFDQLANETMPDLADESIQKLERSLSDLYDKVETIIKPIEAKQEQLAEENNKSMNVLLQKIEKVKQESLTNETVEEIVKKNVEKSMDTLLKNIQELIKPIAAKLEGMQKPGFFPSHPAASCKEIREQNKDSPSDYYWLRGSNGSAVKVFCDMTRTCGGVTGGWMRVTKLDTTKPSYQCPHPLSNNTQHGKNLCARAEAAAGCSEVNYQTNRVPYSEVCGRAIGYQFGSPDGSLSGSTRDVNIDGVYIDGVSLTHGRPRQHIWSFLAALDEYEDSIWPSSKCSCNNGISPPSFVGADYFCDTASRDHWQHIFYPNDPLWDGSGCGQNNNCCTFQNPPWFYKKLGASTNNNIDMRVCRNQEATDEDVLLEKVDIFVR